MTDKQIIIDGVNVAECSHRKKEVTFMNIIKCYNYGACEGVNCLYKQLKRKEQECEEFKSCLINIKEIAEKQCNICEALTSIDEYKDCKKCWQGVILQKISECEVQR